jgi:hypothetical protein
LRDLERELVYLRFGLPEADETRTYEQPKD